VKGTTICIPVINLYGFIHFSRYVPDGKDVNRSFPGSKTGSLASRVAYYLMNDIIPKIDYGIDFHTGGAERFNYPQIRALLQDEELKELARAFQAPFTLNSRYRAKSLRQSAGKRGKKILVYEGGESSRLDEFSIVTGMEGARRVMHHLGMILDSSAAAFENQVISRTSWLRVKYSGLVQLTVNCGDRVRKNQHIGHITDPFGDFKVLLKSPNAGFVIGLNNNPIVHQGDAIINLGLPEQ
jgi:hypothetical protein